MRPLEFLQRALFHSHPNANTRGRRADYDSMIAVAIASCVTRVALPQEWRS